MRLSLNLLCVLVLLVTGLRAQNRYTELYNSRVIKAERVERPLQGWIGRTTGLPHAGVLVTLTNGQKWLVHKTRTEGSSDTVVTSPSNMGPGWSVKQTKFVTARRTVSNYVTAGGTRYSLVFDNCWDAARRMMRL